MSDRYFDTGIKTTGKAYYCNSNNAETNHIITIIGWDDNYSKNNFNSLNKPKIDGAWLIQNSWGTSYNDGGYFWVSYDDAIIEHYIAGVVSVTDIDYDNIYQYDILARSKNISLKNLETSEIYKTVYAANVFHKKENGTEYLKEIAITNSGSRQTVDVYISTNGELDIDKARLVARNVVLQEGYKTIKFEPIKLINSSFAVIVKYKGDEKAIIAIESPIENTAFQTATANANEGYLSEDGKTGNWLDIVDSNENSSICIKAFTCSENSLEIEKDLSYIMPQTKISDLKAQFPGKNVQIYKDETLKAEIRSGYLGTGYVIKVQDINRLFTSGVVR